MRITRQEVVRMFGVHGLDITATDVDDMLTSIRVHPRRVTVRLAEGDGEAVDLTGGVYIQARHGFTDLPVRKTDEAAGEVLVNWPRTDPREAKIRFWVTRRGGSFSWRGTILVGRPS